MGRGGRRYPDCRLYRLYSWHFVDARPSASAQPDAQREDGTVPRGRIRLALPGASSHCSSDPGAGVSLLCKEGSIAKLDPQVYSCTYTQIPLTKGPSLEVNALEVNKVTVAILAGRCWFDLKTILEVCTTWG